MSSQENSEQGDNQNTINCLLCCEDVTMIGIGNCNHKEFCFKCVYKMRELKHSNICPICNSANSQVVITDQHDWNFEDFQLEDLKCWDEKWQLYVDGKNAERAISDLKLIQCFYPNCQEKVKFQSLNFLKKHLKEKHKKSLCDLCVEHKLCVLSEQELYTYEQLQNHLKHGDFDESGIYALHPYCQFCRQNFFDEEQFYQHLQDKHLTCQICGHEQKFRYYDTYKNLETHFKMSHYLCDDINCREKKNVVFRTNAEKDFHYQVHHQHGAKVNPNENDDNVNFGGKKKKQQINISNLANFTYGTEDSNQKVNKRQQAEELIKDNEGILMVNQFLSQRRIKQRESHVTDHSDQILDLREFYQHKYDDKAIQDERNFFDQVLGYNRGGNGGRGRGGRGRGGRQQQQRKSSNTNGPDPELKFKTPKLEDLSILKHTQVNEIDQQKFDMRVEKLQEDDDLLDEYYQTKDNWYRKKCNTRKFIEVYFKVIGRNAGLRLFPHLIRSVPAKMVRQIQDLDNIYMEELKKLPKKFPNLINTSKTYSDFIGQLKQEIEKNILHRINNNKLDLKVKYKMEKTRVMQFLEILKRVHTPEMVHLKFATNFGVSVDSINLITKKVYFSALHNIQKYLDEIQDNTEFLHLYLYICYCDDLVEGNKQEKHHFSTLLLQDFFDKHPDIYKKYKSYAGNDKDDELVSIKQMKKQMEPVVGEDQYKYNKNNKQQNITLTNKVQKEETKRNDEFDTENQFEFPDMHKRETIEIKKEQEKITQKKKLNTTASTKWHGNDGIDKQLSEDAELFPSLGGATGSLQDDIYKKKSSGKGRGVQQKSNSQNNQDLLQREKQGPSLVDQIYGKDKEKMIKTTSQYLDVSDEEEEARLKKLGAVQVQKNKKGKKQKIILQGAFGFGR